MDLLTDEVTGLSSRAGTAAQKAPETYREEVNYQLSGFRKRAGGAAFS